MVDVAHLADGGHAVEPHNAHLAGGHADLGVGALLSHQLGAGAGGADQLAALAGVHLNVVDHGAHRDVGQGQGIAGLDVRLGRGEHLVAGAQAHRSQDIAALAVLILHQRDVGAAVGVVLQAQDRGGHVHLVALEVDDAVLALAAAAPVADGDAAVAVAAGALLEDLGKAGLRLGLLIHTVEAGDGHVPAGRSRRLETFNRHGSLSSLHHTLEELDGLGILGQLDNGLFPVLGAAGTARAHALGLAGDVHGVDTGDLHAEDVLHGLLDLDLAGGGSDLERVFLISGAGHGALGDDGANDDIIRDHYAYTSSMVARAAWSMTRYLALTRS